MPIFDANQNVISAAQIFSALKTIVEESRRLHIKGQIGVLTSDSRDDAFRTYNLLLQENNKESLDTIETGLFLLCLDDDINSEQDPWTKTALNSLHGFGSSGMLDYRVRKRNCHPLMKARGDSYGPCIQGGTQIVTSFASKRLVLAIAT